MGFLFNTINIYSREGLCGSELFDGVKDFAQILYSTFFHPSLSIHVGIKLSARGLIPPPIHMDPMGNTQPKTVKF